MNKLVTDEILGCWQRVGQQPGGEYQLKLFTSDVLENQKACVVCTRIKFDESAIIDNEVGDSMDIYLRNTRHLTATKEDGQPYSLYEYLLDAEFQRTNILPHWEYKESTEDALAVVYMRGKVNLLRKLQEDDILQWIFTPRPIAEAVPGASYFPEEETDTAKQPELDMVQLMPLSEVSEACDYLGNYE